MIADAHKTDVPDGPDVGESDWESSSVSASVPDMLQLVAAVKAEFRAGKACEKGASAVPCEKGKSTPPVLSKDEPRLILFV